MAYSSTPAYTGLGAGWSDSTGSALVRPDGSSIGIGGDSVLVSPSGDTSGAQDSAAISAAITAATAAIKAGSTGSTVLLAAGDFYISSQLVVNDGIAQDYPTAGAANVTVGPNLVGAGKGLTRIHSSVTGAPSILFHCLIALTHLSHFRIAGFTLLGPGIGSAETVGIQIGGVTQSACEDFVVDDVDFIDYTACLRTENVCNGTFNRLQFGGYTRGVEFGYNSDTLVFNECRWGDENDAGKTGIALSYTYRSPFHPTGGLGINAHRFESCWFMRQVCVADIQDPASGVVFADCYYERCTQYAKLGTGASGTGPRGVFWEYCHFSQPNDATETAAKIEVQHSSDDSTLGIFGCRTDDTAGAYIAWVKVGADTSLSWHDNILPTVTNAVISYAGRSISPSQYYQFDLNRRLWSTFDHSLGGSPGNLIEVYAPSYSTGSESQMLRFVNVSKATGSVNSSSYVFTLASDTIAWNGAVRSRRSTALPTATVQWEGVVMTVQGGAGVASVTSVCLKSAADTYSWKTLATG